MDFNEFANNKKLLNLYVGNNQITNIKPINNPTEISITHLMIHDNDLTNISELCKLKKVERLSLTRNRRLDYSKVMFSCWSKLTHLYLVDTNLKHLNHDYRVLTGCNQLIGLDLSHNNLEMLCFEHFPDLPKLHYLNIHANNLINLDVVELRGKCQALSKILIDGNRWSCGYLQDTMKKGLDKFNITWNKIDCLEKSEGPEIRSCPRMKRNRSGISFVPLWIFIIVYFVLFITELVILFIFIF
jgi:Leucine rich repeat